VNTRIYEVAFSKKAAADGFYVAHRLARTSI